MIRQTRLSNGITVFMEDMPQYASASIGVFVKAGSVYEDEKNNGMAHAVEHMMFRGTKRRSDKQLADEMAEIGDMFNAFTSKEYTCYHAKTLTEHLEKAIDILSDMLIHSTMDQENLDREIDIICEEIAMGQDDAEDLTDEKLLEGAWQGHSLALPIAGRAEVVRTFSRQALLDYKNRYYIPSRMAISLSGHFDGDEVLELLEQAFGSLPQGEDLPAKAGECIYHPVFVSNHLLREQMHFSIGFQSENYYSKNRYLLAVISEVLGGGANSRLFRKLRQELGLTYDICSYLSSYESAGMFQIYSSVAPENLVTALNAIMQEIDRLKSEKVSEHELKVAKELIKTELIVDRESTYNRMSNMGKCWVHGEPVMSIAEHIANYNRVTSEDIHLYMSQVAKTGCFALSVVGDLTKRELESIRESYISLQNRKSEEA